MQVRVLYLGMLRDLAGREREVVQLSDGARLSDLYAEIQQRMPKLHDFGNAIALSINYTAYEPMALRQMEELAKQALANYAIRDVRIVHRLGRLQIGETSVYIVAASAHRAAAFDACRWLIDTLKKTVPIWKREFFEDGAVWADGEPFPPGIPRAGGSASK